VLNVNTQALFAVFAIKGRKSIDIRSKILRFAINVKIFIIEIVLFRTAVSTACSMTELLFY